LTYRIIEKGKSVSSDQTLQAQYVKKGNFKKGKKPLIILTKMVKILARIKKEIRKKMQSMIRRRRKIFRAITVRSGDIMHLNAHQRGSEGAKMKLSLLKMRTQTLMKYS